MERTEILALKEHAEKYRHLLNIGECSYAEAKKEIMPYLKAVNEKGKEIAKKYGRRAPNMSLAAFLR